ncbi:hypothetical protein [Cerasicoccus frondis]|uniref:hypothetical protein n=1 Tax=Cerasicoccus frondis TaxID=490090 RepID=UPI002852552C|nr:hypothetical protein [Cerasicoccus frondis]
MKTFITKFLSHAVAKPALLLLIVLICFFPIAFGLNAYESISSMSNELTNEEKGTVIGIGIGGTLLFSILAIIITKACWSALVTDLLSNDKNNNQSQTKVAAS